MKILKERGVTSIRYRVFGDFEVGIQYIQQTPAPGPVGR